METARCLLRSLTLDDAEQLYHLAKDPDIGSSAGWPPHTSVENSREILEAVLIKEHSYGIFDKETKQLLGCIGLNPAPKRENSKALMLGYWIGKEYWGNGYATEASVAMIQYTFDILGMNLLEIDHFATNKKSENVVKKLGFTYEGCIRQAAVGVDGELLDDVIYSMTKEEYKELYKKNQN